ncbi:hypothetical protein D3C87_1334060 [compost metagenome]
MRKLILALALSSISFSAGAANDPKEFEQAKKAWSLFKSCQNAETESTLDKCLAKSLAPNLDPLVSQKMTEYILMEFKFSDLRVCEEKDKVLPLPSKTPVIHYCLNVLGKKTQTQGYVTFEVYQKELRLTAIRYDF